MYKRLISAGAFIALAMVAMVLFSMRGCQEKEFEALRPVRTIILKPVHATSSHTFNGIARSDVAAKLGFHVNGTVKKVYVKVGQRIKKGDIIAELDPIYFKLRVDEVTASVKQTNTKVKHDKNRYERIKKLYVNRSTSLSEMETARAAYESSKASSHAMQTRLEQVQLELKYTKLYSPINGSVSNVLVRKNENVSRAVPVATIGSTKSIEVPVSVPGSLIDNIESGQSCRVVFDAIKNRVFEAEVTEVSHASSLRTTTFPVVVRIIESSKKIHPGMASSVTFHFSNSVGKGNFIVPVHAVMKDHLGNYVYIVSEIKDGIGVIRRQNVKRGELSMEGILLMGGVRKGMRVITAGMSRVEENQKVKVEL